MKTLTFRPLRFVRRINKIVVASYPQWYKIQKADYNQLNLIIDDEYRGFNGEEPVFNHEGQNLFWRGLCPDDLRVFDQGAGLSLEEMRAISPQHGIRWNTDGYVSYSYSDLDCAGTPTFSHKTIKHIINSGSNVTEYDLLTVDMVRKWYGWFLLNLKNSKIKTKV